MKILFIAFVFVSFQCYSQENSSINFEKSQTWSEIKNKAQKSNKIIFIDAYTTWCGPCKQMEIDIFPQKKVADFFNENFINFKVQMDQTAQDNKDIKMNYEDAKFIERTYQIKSYPTYLFLNADGTLVHFMLGATTNADEFIAKAKLALDPNTQYEKLREQFTAGKRDTTFLKSLIDCAGAVYDMDNRAKYIQAFLQQQTNLLTNRNIRYIAQSVKSSKDVGFGELKTHKNEITAVIGAQWRNDIISSVAFDEDLLPLLRRDGKKEVRSGGMIIYSGEVEGNVDWKKIQSLLQDNHGADAEFIYINAKVKYQKWKADWKGLNQTLKYDVSNAKILDSDFVCNLLQYYVSFCEDKQALTNAYQWINLAEKKKAFSCVKTYGEYLYQIGKFKKAIDILSKYQQTLPKPNNDIASLIEKIKDKKLFK
jgi:thioredoxin-related protein